MPTICRQLPKTFYEHSEAAKQGGEIAKDARMALEKKTGKSVISPLNAKQGILLNSQPVL